MGFTERIRHFLLLRWQEAKIMAKLDRTMMFEGQTTFLLRSTRVVAQVRNLLLSAAMSSCLAIKAPLPRHNPST